MGKASLNFLLEWPINIASGSDSGRLIFSLRQIIAGGRSFRL
jgi:hypothetical protein